MFGRTFGPWGSRGLIPGLLPCRRLEYLGQDSSHGLDDLPLQVGRHVDPIEFLYDHIAICRRGRGGPRRIWASNMRVLRGANHAACDTTGRVPVAPTPLR